MKDLKFVAVRFNVDTIIKAELYNVNDTSVDSDCIFCVVQCTYI